MKPRWFIPAAFGLAMAGALVATALTAPDPARAGLASGSAGAAVAFAVSAGMSALFESRRGDGAALSRFRLSALGALVKMAFVGGALAVSAQFAWFRPLPWVVCFALPYFVFGLWLTAGAARSIRHSEREAE